jgi:hypothetical protein
MTDPHNPDPAQHPAGPPAPPSGPPSGAPSGAPQSFGPPQQQWMPQPPVPPQPPRKKRHRMRWIGLVAGLVIVLIIVIAAANSGGGTTTPHAAAPTTPAAAAPLATSAAAPPAAPAGHTVVYAVTGTAKHASLTYTTDGATSTAQEQSAPVPWTKTITVPDNVINVYQLMAQNTGSGTVTCTITVDGAVAKTVTATGAYAIASCSTT